MTPFVDRRIFSHTERERKREREKERERERERPEDKVAVNVSTFEFHRLIFTVKCFSIKADCRTVTEPASYSEGRLNVKRCTNLDVFPSPCKQLDQELSN